jgi:hypothetical protein
LRLAEALAAGQLGQGVRLGAVAISAEGGVTYALEVGAAEWRRVAEAAGAGALVSVSATLELGWMIHEALPAGALIGLAFATARIIVFRRRLRRRADQLLAGLALERGQ